MKGPMDLGESEEKEVEMETDGKENDAENSNKVAVEEDGGDAKNDDDELSFGDWREQQKRSETDGHKDGNKNAIHHAVSSLLKKNRENSNRQNSDDSRHSSESGGKPNGHGQ